MTDVPLEPPQTPLPVMTPQEARRSHICRVAAFVLLEIAFASIAVALVVVEDIREDGWPSLESVDVRWPIAAALVSHCLAALLVALSTASGGAAFDERRGSGRVVALLDWAPFVLTAATAAMASIYILPARHDGDRATWLGLLAPAVGLLVAAAIWLVLELVDVPVRRAQSRSANLIQLRSIDLDIRLGAWCPEDESDDTEHGSWALTRVRVCREARTAYRAVTSEPHGGGDALALVDRLVDIWETLVYVAPRNWLIDFGRWSEAWLVQSRLERRDDLLYKIRLSVLALGDTPPLSADQRTPQARRYARIVLRDVSHVINVFNAAREAGIVRARTTVGWICLFAGVTAAALLGAAIIARLALSFVVVAIIFSFVTSTVSLSNHLWLNAAGTAQTAGRIDRATAWIDQQVARCWRVVVNWAIRLNARIPRPWTRDTTSSRRSRPTIPKTPILSDIAPAEATLGQASLWLRDLPALSAFVGIGGIIATAVFYTAIGASSTGAATQTRPAAPTPPGTEPTVVATIDAAGLSGVPTPQAIVLPRATPPTTMRLRRMGSSPTAFAVVGTGPIVVRRTQRPGAPRSTVAPGRGQGTGQGWPPP